MSPNRTRARRWLVERGLPLVYERTLAEMLVEAEERVLLAVARTHGAALANRIAEQLAQSPSVAPLDGSAQPGEHVADEHRATAPAGG
jgi:hypothetical protein